VADGKPGNPTNIVTLAILALVTAMAVLNIATALLDGSVWILTGSGTMLRGFGTTPTQIYRSDDPLTFYVTLILTPAFAVFLGFNLWRKYRQYNKHR
jgi:hypothetical protein